MHRLWRAGIAAAATLGLAGPAFSQPNIDIEPELVLPTAPLERAETCAAYLTMAHAIALSAKPQTAERATQAKDFEARTLETVGYAYKVADEKHIAHADVDKRVQAKANQLSALSADFAAHAKSLGANTGLCMLESMRNHAPPVAVAAGKTAREEGDALIAAANGADLFENLTQDGKLIVVRHKASGLVCLLEPKSTTNRLVVFPGVRGDDVGCGAASFTGVRTWYAKRNTRNLTLDQAFREYAQSVRDLDKNAKPYVLTATAASSPMIKALGSPKLPAIRVARFTSKDIYTSVTVAIVNDWVVELRYSAPLAMSEFASGNAEPMSVLLGLGQITGVIPAVLKEPAAPQP